MAPIGCIFFEGGWIESNGEHYFLNGQTRPNRNKPKDKEPIGVVSYPHDILVLYEGGAQPVKRGCIGLEFSDYEPNLIYCETINNDTVKAYRIGDDLIYGGKTDTGFFRNCKALLGFDIYPRYGVAPIFVNNEDEYACGIYSDITVSLDEFREIGGKYVLLSRRQSYIYCKETGNFFVCTSDALLCLRYDTIIGVTIYPASGCLTIHENGSSTMIGHTDFNKIENPNLSVVPIFKNRKSARKA